MIGLVRLRSIVGARLLAAAIVCAPISLAGTADLAAAAERFPGANWERVEPDGAGWSKEKLTKAEAWSKRIGSTAVMIVHHGAVVAEWGDTAAKTPLASVRKSLLSALIGNAVERGEINLAQTLGVLGIDDNEPSLTAEEKTATVGDLLKARSGIYHAALYETPGMAADRPPRFSHKPGTFWYYNNWDFNALGAIYEHAARSSIFDAFEREIARPIGMQDYRPADGEYVTGAESIHPAYPFKMSARDLARFALLYLRKGQWAGPAGRPGALGRAEHAGLLELRMGPWLRLFVVDRPDQQWRGPLRHSAAEEPTSLRARAVSTPS